MSSRYGSAIHELLSWLDRLRVALDCGQGYFYGYDLSRGRVIEPVYTEITGYGLSLHVFLYTVLQNDTHKDTAWGLVRFLVAACSRTPSGIAPYGLYLGRGEWSSLVYSFDNGVVAKGLFDAYRVLRDEKLLVLGLKICRWLIDAMQRGDGGFRAAYNYVEKRFVDFREWYGDGGCLHGKLAIPLLMAWRLSGDEKYRTAAEKLVQRLLRLQSDSGAFMARENAGYVYHHAHCYALEGLLYAWRTLREDRLLEHIIRSAKWLAKVQHRSGGIPDFHPLSLVRRLATDATTQAVRIWLILHKATGEDYWLVHAEKGFEFLSRAVVKRGRGRGALPAYLYAFGPLKKVASRVYTWSLMFTLQALFMYEKLDNLSLDDVVKSLF